VNLWTCTFVTGGAALLPSNFHYVGVSAIDVEVNPKSVNLSANVAACVYGPYCGDGILDPQEACDDGNTAAGDCCSPTCAYESTATVCRAAAGGCDAPENCTGSSSACPADSRRSAAFVCRASAGACDLNEVCNGTSPTCPADVRSTAVCRPSAGFCDVAETCTGLAVTCPADQFKTLGTACTDDSNVCTNDACNNAGGCAHSSNSQPCNDSLFCNGSDTCGGTTCSIHVGSPCSGADGDGDCSETCVEASDTCSGNDPDLSTCNDGNANTSVDQCISGSCVGMNGGVICGDANANGTIQSSDALQVLRKAVGTPDICAPQRCDTDNSGSISSSDALRVLRKAVGLPEPLTCPS
jgi:cysteine-rich repeat protein